MKKPRDDYTILSASNFNERDNVRDLSLAKRTTVGFGNLTLFHFCPPDVSVETSRSKVGSFMDDGKWRLILPSLISYHK
jgi:hypothetical protein